MSSLACHYNLRLTSTPSHTISLAYLSPCISARRGLVELNDSISESADEVLGRAWLGLEEVHGSSKREREMGNGRVAEAVAQPCVNPDLLPTFA